MENLPLRPETIRLLETLRQSLRSGATEPFAGPAYRMDGAPLPFARHRVGGTPEARTVGGALALDDRLVFAAAMENAAPGNTARHAMPEAFSSGRKSGK